jgi:hypothetical protein
VERDPAAQPGTPQAARRGGLGEFRGRAKRPNERTGIPVQSKGGAPAPVTGREKTGLGPIGRGLRGGLHQYTILHVLLHGQNLKKMTSRKTHLEYRESPVNYHNPLRKYLYDIITN